MALRFCIFAVLCVAVVAPAAEPAALDRPYDPVIVSTARLAALPGRRVDALRLVSLRDGVAQPIPFQIDPRDSAGRLELDRGDPITFDANDDFVFMAGDAGERATAAPWPPQCGPGLELTVREPDGSAQAWAYLAHCAALPPPPPAPAYVFYDRATNRARSAHYEVEYAAGRNYFTALRLIEADGTAGANLLRQTRMRGSPTFGLLVADFSLEFTEQNAIVEVQGVRNGPVRAIRRAKLAVDLGAMIPDLPQGTAETFHYRNGFVTPTRFGIPAIALRMLRDFHFENMIDFNPQAMPLLYWNASRASGVALAADTPETVEDPSDHDWWVHSGADGAVLHALLIPQQWRDWGITRGALLRGGCAAGGPCAAGYTLQNMTRLQRAGDFDLKQATVVLPRPYQPGDERAAMAMLTRPVEVDVAVLP